ncbi:NAD(P)H-binding protein [Planomonospora sp. ID67723]|uniref:NAD(P)H-binding protein n=1 Tax=Planomonospora sp. ID67723 TaxID=2738134 RepID=UPI0018C357EC|nr:NAD(P)H-binding protein [Planomonospora sp. ID67723]MBG0827778.1 NAD(P)H-binding protein [Planomonospora sp. ID67723]
MILVTGATGNVGREVLRALVRAGAPARALLRTEGEDVAGVEQVTGDLNEPASLEAALTGVRAVFLLPGYRDMPGLAAEMTRAGVEHVVLLSSLAAMATDTDNAVSEYMIRSETAVRESGLAWTFLRPSAFMSNTLRWTAQLRAGDIVRDAFGDVPTASIDPYDIAAVAVRALLAPGHEGRIHLLSGPHPLLPADRVRVLGQVLGRDLRFEGLSDEDARAQMSATMPAAYVEAFFGFYRDGTIDEATVRPGVHEITGRPPRTFAQWAAGQADAFR